MDIIPFGEEEELNHIEAYESVPWSVSCTSTNIATVLKSCFGYPV